MDAKPRISVLINNYNYGDYIAEAIESVLQQSYENFEIIIVDDGSTDHSKGIIVDYQSRYQDKIIAILKKNGGQGSAYNLGFKNSTGEIICFLDSDDYWFNNKLATIVKAHQNFEVVQHNLLENGKPYKNLSNIFDRQFLMKKFGYYGSFAPSSALSFSRNVLQMVFPIPEKPLVTCADAYVRNLAVYHAEIHSVNECLGVYRIHGKNLWNNEDILKSDSFMRIPFEITVLINEKLMSTGLFPIPYFNQYLKEKVVQSSLQISVGAVYLIYGTGSTANRIFHLVEQSGGKVLFFSDSNADKWGVEFLGRKVISPSMIKEVRKDIEKIIVASMHVIDILEYLVKLGYKESVDIMYPISI